MLLTLHVFDFSRLSYQLCAWCAGVISAYVRVCLKRRGPYINTCNQCTKCAQTLSRRVEARCNALYEANEQRGQKSTPFFQKRTSNLKFGGIFEEVAFEKDFCANTLQNEKKQSERRKKNVVPPREMWQTMPNERKKQYHHI